ncbi:MAG: sigma-70 family RNA polymerase sigma factor [Candidatus Caenarcaniphilales bacterium]|nr:sigma-70 family RNA polymerase sigma factor [Candidatus Caenarcaniphilales bacterium]
MSLVQILNSINKPVISISSRAKTNAGNLRSTSKKSFHSPSSSKASQNTLTGADYLKHQNTLGRHHALVMNAKQRTKKVVNTQELTPSELDAVETDFATSGLEGELGDEDFGESTTSSKGQTGNQFTTDSVRAYLREIGRIPLLTPEKEIQYGKQVQLMMAFLAVKGDNEMTDQQWLEAIQNTSSEVKDQFSGDIKKKSKKTETQPAVIAEESKPQTIDELTKAIQAGQRAKKKMIEANLRLVVSIAKKYPNRGMELLDLIQEGSLGLTRAVEKFDPSKGCKFSTYAHWWIKQAITRAISDKARTIRLPVHIIDRLNKIKRARRELSASLQREPNLKEISTYLEIPINYLKELIQASKEATSLDNPIGEDTALGDLLSSELPSPEKVVNHKLLEEDLKNLLSNLTDQQQLVINLRFGLESGQKQTLEQISTILNLTKERVRQIEGVALNKLRKKACSLKSHLLNT